MMSLDPNSIVDYLKSKGMPSDMDSRKTLALRLGITNYTGSADQNTRMLAMLRTGGAPGLGVTALWTRIKELFTRR